MLSDVQECLYSYKEDKKLNFAINALIALVVVTLIFEIIFSVFFSGIYVVGSSMEPTLNGAAAKKVAGGDYVYVNKFAKPDYEDIVVVICGDLDERGNVKHDKDGKIVYERIIKRVIALGGDTVRLKDGKLQIKYSKSSSRYTGADDFVDVTENYVDPDCNKGNGSQPLTFPFQNWNEGYLISDGCFFLMGDNRDYSLDSRVRGEFKIKSSDSKEGLVGVVTEWSMDRKGTYTSLYNFFSFGVKI